MKIIKYTCQGKRNYNEDRYCIIKKEKDIYCAIYDGHGGDEVSKYLKTHLLKEVISDDKKSHYKNYIHSIFKKVSDKLDTYLKKKSTQSGSTALIVIIKDKKILVANAGDCRAVMCRNGIGIPLTVDHKPSYIEENKRITSLGGKIKFDKYIKNYRINGLAVSRSFGDLDIRPYVTSVPDIYKYIKKKEDKFIIIASDGLWDVLSNQDAVELVKSHLTKPADFLANTAIKRGSEDNITVIIIYF